ncbi:MAG: SDR family NAD(P)-dependent oxidoreductase, partial [Eubacteriales bacterium]|nr:SDR family NAD(P)-dependent oxidoreductase [Eubacteriales bacterium]MDD4584077.1 SDR family NAD(P)-dependent oxidoreductase [Eubacteriales bacterium]
ESMKDKVVIITGGSGGMGKACAKKFLEDGSIVYIADINKDNLSKTVDELSVLGEIHSVITDVTKISDIENLISTVVKNSGKIDVLVNGAGVWVEGNTDEMTEKMWDWTIDVNLKGTFFMCSKAIPELEKTKGCIVNISSDAGIGGNPGNSIYNASKGGITLITKSLGLELAPRQIRVNAVAPADVMSPMLEYQANTYGGGDPEGYYNSLLSKYPQQPHARFIKVEEIAECVYFLANPAVWPITATTLSIDCGLTAGY